jgi:hypothetical protein
MAARDGKVSRLDVISITIASLSLAVSAVAGVVSYKAWTRPAPADPTYIPTFGQSGKPEPSTLARVVVSFSRSWTGIRAERSALSPGSMTAK